MESKRVFIFLAALLSLGLGLYMTFRPDEPFALGQPAGTPVDAARRAIENEGYTKVVLGDTSWVSCEKHAKLRRLFTAVRTSDQKTVNGIVCCTTGMGCVIRWP